MEGQNPVLLIRLSYIGGRGDLWINTMSKCIFDCLCLSVLLQTPLSNLLSLDFSRSDKKELTSPPRSLILYSPNEAGSAP